MFAVRWSCCCYCCRGIKKHGIALWLRCHSHFILCCQHRTMVMNGGAGSYANHWKVLSPHFADAPRITSFLLGIYSVACTAWRPSNHITLPWLIRNKMGVFRWPVAGLHRRPCSSPVCVQIELHSPQYEQVAPGRRRYTTHSRSNPNRVPPHGPAIIMHAQLHWMTKSHAQKSITYEFEHTEIIIYLLIARRLTRLVRPPFILRRKSVLFQTPRAARHIPNEMYLIIGLPVNWIIIIHGVLAVRSPLAGHCGQCFSTLRPDQSAASASATAEQMNNEYCSAAGRLHGCVSVRVHFGCLKQKEVRAQNNDFSYDIYYYFSISRTRKKTIKSFFYMAYLVFVVGIGIGTMPPNNNLLLQRAHTAQLLSFFDMILFIRSECSERHFDL